MKWSAYETQYFPLDTQSKTVAAAAAKKSNIIFRMSSNLIAWQYILKKNQLIVECIEPLN